MSASNQKKIRQQEREAYRSERERQDALEAQKLRKQTIAFVLVIALCLSIFLGSFLVSPIKNVIYRNTIAVTVGDHDLTATDVNYFYVDAINNYINQYYYYIYLGYIKLDMSTPLDQQVTDSSTGETWADSFLKTAVENIKSTYGLYDLAMKNGHKLTDEEQKELDELEGNLKESAKTNSFTSVKEMLQSTYGNGANLESYLAYYEICTYANSFYTAYEESLEYDSETLREYEGNESYKYNSYDYAYYLLNVSLFLPDGVTEAKATDEQKKAAQEACKELADQLATGFYANLDEFDAAINAAIKELKGEELDEDEYPDEIPEDEIPEDEIPEDEYPEDEYPEDEIPKDEIPEDEIPEDEIPEDEEEEEVSKYKYSSTKQEDVLYSSVTSLFQKWIAGIVETEEDEESEESETEDEEEEEEEEPEFETRYEGDLTVIENSSGSGDSKTIKGYYIVRFGAAHDNSYALADVRHVLVKFQGGNTNETTGQTTYTDAEKQEAKTEAEKLYNEWLASGKLDEDSFADLAMRYSDDGNASEGGLYEGVYPGQMVDTFNDWCFDEDRQPGDHGIVETEYGYHLMFFVGDNEQSYRDYMVSDDKRAEDMEEWFDDIIENSEYEEKNMKYVLMDKILGL